jgi:hypothetical protein
MMVTQRVTVTNRRVAVKSRVATRMAVKTKSTTKMTAKESTRPRVRLIGTSRLL